MDKDLIPGRKRQTNSSRLTKTARALMPALLLAGLFGLGVQSQAEDVLDGYNPETDAPSNQVGFDFEGCRLANDETTYDPADGSFRCDLSAYTDGNLGKLWAELDEVPHQLFIETSGITTATETFRIVIGADHLVDTDTEPDTIGYDRISSSPPYITKISGAGTCSATPVLGNQIGDYGIGGAIDQIAQVVEITQDADTVCRLDWVFRLAIGSRFISGSSNHAYVVAGGEQRIPIPSEPAPQELSKTMSAVEDSLINWTIMKNANPTNFGFGNTCNLDVPNTKDVIVDITFSKGATEFGDLTATTMVQAVNPSRRTVSYDCTDDVYGVPDGEVAEELVDSQSLQFDVEPGMTTEEIEHILPPGTRSIRDELTCELSIEDAFGGGYEVIGNIDASFSLPDEDIAPGEVVNESVTVSDTESITVGATRYDFSAVQSSGVSGAFVAYTPGTLTDGPVVWNSDPQSESGTVQFTKTVTVERGYDVDGKLEDTASIDLTDTTDVSAMAATDFTTDPKIDLKITKNLSFTVSNATTWKFKVCTSNDCGGAGDPDLVTTEEITIPAGSSSGNATVDDLDPDTYYVVEYDLPTGWVPQSNPQMVALTLPSCAEEVTFSNSPAANFFAEVEVKKITDPAGSEAGWTFDLAGSGNDSAAQATTTDANFIRFNLDGGDNLGADAGSYSITEQLLNGWELATPNATSLSIVGCLDGNQDAGPTPGVNSCDFSVAYEQYAGCTFQCTFTNIELGTIIVEKQTLPDGSLQTFTFSGDAADTIGDGGTIQEDDLSPGSYTSTETVPDGWDLTDISCDDDSSASASSGDTGTATASFELDPGETITCTFTNTERGMADVTKTVLGNPPLGEQSFDFDIRIGASVESQGTAVASATANAGNWQDVPFTCVSADPAVCVDVGGMAKLPAGDYQFCELNVMPGWTTSIALLPGYFVPNWAAPDPDNSVYCVPFTLDPGETESFAVDNSPPPDGDARTIGFWKNWTSCDGHGNQDPVLDETLALAGGSILLGNYNVDSCEKAVLVLDKREATGRNKKKASDPCFNAGSQLLASKLNAVAGAGCSALTVLQSATDALLIQAGFNGSACNLNKRSDRDLIQALVNHAGQLDAYNNNEPGSVCD